VLLRRLLSVADVIAGALVGTVLATRTRAGVDGVVMAAAFLPAWVVLAKVHGLYDRDKRTMRHLTVDEMPAIALWAFTGTAVLTAIFSLIPPGRVEISAAVGAWLVGCAAGSVLRSVARLSWRRITPPERTLILGSGPLADSARRKLALFSDLHVEVLERQLPLSANNGRLVIPHQVDRIVLASRTIDEVLIAKLISFCRDHEIKLSVVPPVRELAGTAVRLEQVADLPVLGYMTWDVSRSTLLIKRVIDFVVSAAAIVVAAPLLMLIAAAISLESGRPVLYKQARAGLGGRPFRIYKFRTMVANAEDLLRDLLPFESLSEPMFKLRGDPRVTRVGRSLRRWSLDELPQLWNVLRGDMSLVGPRPEQVEIVQRYSDAERFRLDVRPGLTGPMQVFGRGELTFEERLAVERDYIENLSISRDLRILGLTLASVVSGRGAY